MGNIVARLIVALLPVTLLATGCVSPTVAPTGSQPDRLKQFYSDLSSGRFLILADFEDPAHAGLFELVNASGKAQMSAQAAKGRAETGGVAMSFTAASPEDAIVGAGRADGEYLKRDWRPFDLLLISVHAPALGLSVRVVAASGAAGDRRTTETSVPLQQGWNTVRLDLAELADNIAIDDVRELRLAISGQRRPVEVIIDDLLLTASREDLFGDSANTSGGMYVQRVGRRWNVGAGGRFELTLMNGQVRRLYILASDSSRVHNLVEGVSLGPIPVAIDPEGRHASLTPPGGRILVQQQIVEMNPVRVIVDLNWKVEPAGSDQRDEPSPDSFRWRYVIYPSGKIYVTTEAVRGHGIDWPTTVGALVAFSSNGISVSTSADGVQTASRLASAVHEPTGASLLVVPLLASESSSTLLPSRDEVLRQTGVILPESNKTGGITSWHTLMLVQPGPTSGAEPSLAGMTPEALAAAYLESAALEISIGSAAEEAARPDGFDPALGHFACTPEADRLRIKLDGGARPVYAPAFKVNKSAGRDAWVYVDHLVQELVARDANGDLVFQIPQTVRKSTLVEVILRNSPASPTP